MIGLGSRRNRQGRAGPLLRGGLALLIFAGLWEVVSIAGIIDLPPPTEVGETFFRLLAVPDPIFGKTITEMVALSLGIVVRGGLVGIILGIAVGMVLATFFRLKEFLLPVVGIMQPIPPLAWLPLAYILFASTASPSVWVQVFVVAVAVFFPVLAATWQGVEYIPPIYGMVARTLGAEQREIVRRVSLPAAFPSIISGVRVGLGVGWMSIIAAEFVGGKTGIGFYIWNAYSVGGRVSEIVAGIVAIGITGFAINSGLHLLERRLTPWH